VRWIPEDLPDLPGLRDLPDLRGPVHLQHRLFHHRLRNRRCRLQPAPSTQSAAFASA